MGREGIPDAFGAIPLSSCAPVAVKWRRGGGGEKGRRGGEEEDRRVDIPIRVEQSKLLHQSILPSLPDHSSGPRYPSWFGTVPTQKKWKGG